MSAWWEKMVVISNGNYRSDKSASGRINFVRLISLLPLWQGREPWREVSVGIFHPNFKLSVVYTTRMHAKTATCPALLFKNFKFFAEIGLPPSPRLLKYA